MKGPLLQKQQIVEQREIYGLDFTFQGYFRLERRKTTICPGVKLNMLSQDFARKKLLPRLKKHFHD